MKIDLNQTLKWRYRRTKFFLFFLVIILFIGYFFCGQGIWFYLTAKGYQSIFLTNGQVYFGKISSSGRFIKLSDVYYLQAKEPLQSGVSDKTSSSNNIQLVKLGSELHGPTDTMYVQKDNILFWENLKDNSKVVEAIKKNKSN